jgi:signal transduction histidine kinase
MRKLYTQIYLHFVGVLIFVGLASSAVLAHGFRTAFLRRAATGLAEHAAELLAPLLDAQDARDVFLRRFADHLNVDVTVRDSSQRLVTTAGPELPPLDDAESARLQRHASFFHGQHRNYSAAIIVDPKTGARRGYVEIATRFHFNNELYRPLIAVTLVLLITGIATAPLARRISRPVEQLTEASRRLGAGELAYRIPDRRRLHRRWHAHPERHLRRRRDELDVLVATWNDMAERIQALVGSHRELLANVSHELRSPLARIRVALALLPGDARVADIETDLGELERLIDDVLTTSRLEATGLPMRIGEVDVRALFDELVVRAGHDPMVAGKEVRALAGPPIVIAADGALLKRALWNLVENAAKYGAPPITLEAIRSGDRLTLAVTDEGPGIAASERERVFAPFYRADKARTAGGGFGLGLTLARRVAEVHCGTIGVEARAHGCRVVISLPLKS